MLRIYSIELQWMMREVQRDGTNENSWLVVLWWQRRWTTVDFHEQIGERRLRSVVRFLGKKVSWKYELNRIVRLSINEGWGLRVTLNTYSWGK